MNNFLKGISSLKGEILNTIAQAQEGLEEGMILSFTPNPITQCLSERRVDLPVTYYPKRDREYFIWGSILNSGFIGFAVHDFSDHRMFTYRELDIACLAMMADRIRDGKSYIKPLI